MANDKERKSMFEPRVIYVMESVEKVEEKKKKDNYKSKASLIIGVVHILCAAVTVATYLYGEYVSVLTNENVMKDCKPHDPCHLHPHNCHH